MTFYIDTRDWWIGYYRGDTHHYVCPLPCLVIRCKRGALAELRAELRWMRRTR